MQMQIFLRWTVLQSTPSRPGPSGKEDTWGAAGTMGASRFALLEPCCDETHGFCLALGFFAGFSLTGRHDTEQRVARNKPFVPTPKAACH